MIIKHPDGSIATNLYRKPTEGNYLLHVESAHPRHLIKGIPVGQYLHIRRNCTSIKVFKTQADALRERFLKRGYSHKALKRAYKKDLESLLELLLFQGEHLSKDNKIGPIMKFNKQSNDISAIRQVHWHLLAQDSTIEHSVDPIHPIQWITFKKNCSLRDSLSSRHQGSDSCRAHPKGTF